VWCESCDSRFSSYAFKDFFIIFLNLVNKSVQVGELVRAATLDKRFYLRETTSFVQYLHIAEDIQQGTKCK